MKQHAQTVSLTVGLWCQGQVGSAGLQAAHRQVSLRPSSLIQHAGVHGGACNTHKRAIHQLMRVAASAGRLEASSVSWKRADGSLPKQKKKKTEPEFDVSLLFVSNLVCRLFV